MTSSQTSGSDRQLDRNKALARISAMTLGAGAAGLVGAVAIAVTLPGSTALSAMKSTGASTLSSGSTATDDDGSSSTSTSTAQGQALTQTPLQSGPAPATTNNPPVATSGAS